jgi:hypothetical protein
LAHAEQRIPEEMPPMTTTNDTNKALQSRDLTTSLE